MFKPKLRCLVIWVNQEKFPKMHYIRLMLDSFSKKSSYDIFSSFDQVICFLGHITYIKEGDSVCIGGYVLIEKGVRMIR